MGSIERKLKRKNKGSTKKDAEKALATKIASFGKLPDKCLTCELAFDKTNKEMVKAWNVVVKEKGETVRLYCPECWTKAIEILNNFKEHLEKKHENE
jgi:hypothetical protein